MTVGLKLDRMAIEEVGLNPRRLAEAIHVQLGQYDGSVPVREIALSLDIDEIREERLTNLEAALVTTPERDKGKILLNLQSSKERRRFSLAHELLHFLNPTHEQTSENGFRCSKSDMRLTGQTSDRHRRQETEANTFAIELLAPRTRLSPFVRGKSDLNRVLAMADQFEISREAAARRYVELHPDDLAVVICKDSRFVYAYAGPQFPRFDFLQGQPCDLGGRSEGAVTGWEDTAADDWIAADARAYELWMQTLWQGQGYSMTLLRADRLEEEDEPGFDDAFDRFSRE